MLVLSLGSVSNDYMGGQRKPGCEDGNDIAVGKRPLMFVYVGTYVQL